ncbi:transcription factor, variant 2 [Salvia divinorum]|uniref:Transcription factor, variant 2 n=1 Tax=Salvia divinorum TaxID=28513 RepID=A0ABD1FKT9_SALDI
MEGGDICRVSSARLSSSNVWRNTGVEVFSKSSAEADDEEALKWAALEKLPTNLRVKRGILTEDEGKSREVDVKNLGLVERKNLVERLLQIAEEGNEKFLLKLKERIQRVGLDLPTIEVRYEHLSVDAEAYVGGRALPTVFNFIANILEGFLSSFRILPSRKKPLPILHNVSGIIKPGRMTLLLGPPSSGKTTLLLALAGKLDPELKVSGLVTYNGHEMNEFVPQRTSAYISQHDLHIGEMTVRETLAFSARCQGVGARLDMLAELSRREKEANIKPDPDLDVFMKASSIPGQEESVVTDYIIKILGLEVCADTLVGDEMVRGISGGQRKRLTTGEMLVGPARALFMDEISTDGQIVYQGPRENVLEFFEHMGFRCPDRKGVADFLQEVTSKKDQVQYWTHKDEPYSYVSVKEFSEAFQSFHVGRKLGDELAVPFDKAKSHPTALTTDRYGVSKKMLLKACVDREFLLMKRNSFVYIFKLAQIIMMAIISSTLFLKTEMHKKTVTDGGIYMGALFFALLTNMFNGFSDLAMSIMKLPVFYKQRDLLFFPPWAYSLPAWMLKIPITLVEAAVWVVLTYYTSGYDSYVGRFFRQMLVLFCMSQMASALFRLMGALGRNIIVANTFGSCALLTVLVLGGFILSRENIKKWWIWGYWISPLMYGQNAIAVNELLGKSWSHIPPGSTDSVGVSVLKSRGIFTDARWYWIGVGALIAYTFLFNLLYVAALTYLNPLGKPQAVISDETLAERNAIKIGQDFAQNAAREDQAVSSRENRKRGMILPFQPLSITFDDILYAVDMPPEMRVHGVEGKRLELLKGVSGAFRPGVLTALMGVSGAGKTTLMDVLAGRKTGGYIEGTIKISGYPKKQETFARIAGYSWLRLPPDVDAAARKMFIDEVMELVELTSLRGSLVGLPGVNGLSTEQRKRLTIAVELVANPSIIFMDEPTSGLDARAAAIVMRTVRNTVDTGRTVICTIHQPSIDIFEAFDELLLLKRGGEEIYVGPLGRHSSHLINYFEGIQGVSNIKDGYNPATWMLDITAPAQAEALGVDFNQLYRNSELYTRNKALINELSEPAPGSRDVHFPKRYSKSFWTQCMACLWKQHWSYWRNPPYTAVRFLFTTFIAVMKRQQDIFNAMGSMYTAVLFLGIQNATSVQPVVAVERTVFYRERAAGMYSALPYAFGQAVVELPHLLLQTLIYGVIVYAMIGFEWTAVKFFWYLFLMYFTLLYFTLYGMMIVAVTPNHNIAAIVSSAFYAIWNIFSGFIIPKTRMPVWWRWYYYVCPISWSLYGLVASQFGDIEAVLDTNETVGDFVMTYFDFKHDFVGYVAVIIVGIGVLFGFIFAFSIRAFNFQKR